MCIQDMAPHRAQTLWWALVAYFRAYPPLVQGHGGTRPRPRAEPQDRTVEKAMRRIRIYW